MADRVELRREWPLGLTRKHFGHDAHIPLTKEYHHYTPSIIFSRTRPNIALQVQQAGWECFGRLNVLLIF